MLMLAAVKHHFVHICEKLHLSPVANLHEICNNIPHVSLMATIKSKGCGFEFGQTKTRPGLRVLYTAVGDVAVDDSFMY